MIGDTARLMRVVDDALEAAGIHVDGRRRREFHAALADKLDAEDLTLRRTRRAS